MRKNIFYPIFFVLMLATNQAIAMQEKTFSLANLPQELIFIIFDYSDFFDVVQNYSNINKYFQKTYESYLQDSTSIIITKKTLDVFREYFRGRMFLAVPEQKEYCSFARNFIRALEKIKNPPKIEGKITQEKLIVMIKNNLRVMKKEIKQIKRANRRCRFFHCPCFLCIILQFVPRPTCNYNRCKTNCEIWFDDLKDYLLWFIGKKEKMQNSAMIDQYVDCVFPCFNWCYCCCSSAEEICKTCLEKSV